MQESLSLSHCLSAASCRVTEALWRGGSWLLDWVTSRHDADERGKKWKKRNGSKGIEKDHGVFVGRVAAAAPQHTKKVGYSTEHIIGSVILTSWTWGAGGLPPPLYSISRPAAANMTMSS